MQIPDHLIGSKTKIIKCYHNLINYYFQVNPNLEVGKNSLFDSFLEVLYPLVQYMDFYNGDIFIDAVADYFFSGKVENKSPTWTDVEELLIHIKNTFAVNMREHFLIFPLELSELSNDIFFDNFYILKKRELNDLCKKISEITSVDEKEVSWFMEHTIKSRSPHFPQHNMMLIKIEEQTDNIRYLSYWYAQYAIYFLRLLFISGDFKKSIFLTYNSGVHENNQHVQILSKDSWRRGHGFNWNADFKCAINLDFMSQKQYQEKFLNFVETFLRNKNKDTLVEKFENSLRLMMKANFYRSEHSDATVALILYIASLESLMKDRIGDIRIRLAVTIPRVINMDVSKFLGEIYSSRNNFVHTGKHFNGDNDKLDKIEKICCAMIMKYFDLDKIFVAGKSRLKSWEEYLDTIFDSHIFGNLSDI